MAVHVTRCPHCQTSFRVRDEHLSAARGMVRCGSCLQVFKAAEHFIDGDAAPAAAKTLVKAPATAAQPARQPAPPKPAAVKPPAPADDDDDFGLIHDNMDDEPLQEKMADDPFVDFNLRTPEKQPRPAPRFELELDESITSLRNASSTTLDFVDPEKAGKGQDDDEAWADALLQDDPQDDIAPPPKRPVLNEAEFNFDLPPPEEDDFRGFLDDDEDEAGLAATKRPSKNTGKNTGKNTSFALNGDDELTQQAQEIAIPVRNVPRLQAEPLQFQEPTANHRRLPWGWLSGIVLMLIIAAAQTLYFRFDDWARTPQWRPLYSQLCAQLNCTLPKVQNVREMNTQHLVVRAHPKLQKALMVDTLLLNRADYEQPFPDLLLVFSDLNDRVVASRRFTPAQYLSGELAGQQDMPVRTPVHIALELVDPGPEAVSYAIDLLGNQ
ncbi:DUF3426 domain-containing protein [Oceanospirillaceae bacterium ASx5O]|nr:DUF3426 domain-containing protein [Oceanospirillaceae bacterium ASx5O]